MPHHTQRIFLKKECSAVEELSIEVLKNPSIPLALNELSLA